MLGAEHPQWYARVRKDFESLLGASGRAGLADGVQASLEVAGWLRPFLSESGQHALAEQLFADAWPSGSRR